MIKKYIPKRCIEAPLDCKKIASNAKEAINHLAKIDNYASPQVILAVYCKGESVWIIPKIIAPARHIDAIILNLQQRAYLTGQIVQMYNSKDELQNQLSYSTKNVGDFARDGYFAMNEARDFLYRTAIQTKNAALSFANKLTGLFGIDISKAIMDEPQYWSQKLSDARNLSSQQITKVDLSSSEDYSSDNSQKSIEKLNRLRTRNYNLSEEIGSELGNLWTGWYISYLKISIYDYNTSHISKAGTTHRLLSQADTEQREYLYNSAYVTLQSARNEMKAAISERAAAEAAKHINYLKFLMWVIAILGFFHFYRKHRR